MLPFIDPLQMLTAVVIVYGVLVESASDMIALILWCFQESAEECGAHLSIWSAGLFISKWRSAHRRGVRARLYTDDPEYRRVLREQELQLRSTVSLSITNMCVCVCVCVCV